MSDENMTVYEEYTQYELWMMCICGRLLSTREILAWLLSEGERLTPESLDAIKGMGAPQAEAVHRLEKILRMRVSNASALEGVQELAKNSIGQVKQIQAVFDSIFDQG